MPFQPIPGSEDQELDQHLANITDRILSGDMTTQSETQPREMETLRKTLLRIQSAVKPERPDAAMAERIKERLQVEWKRTRNEPQRVWRRPRWVPVIGLAVLGFAGVIAFGIPAAGALSGAANTAMPWMSFVGILCVLLIGILLWIDHRC
ncbi:MAG: hypothetical protein QUV05_06020 [Phycisphaerae bacterium]|nr:hypothetical protein [Phycisphaerae bacterium]